MRAHRAKHGIRLRFTETICQRQQVVLEQVGFRQLQTPRVQRFKHGVGAQLVLDAHANENQTLRDNLAHECGHLLPFLLVKNFS